MAPGRHGRSAPVFSLRLRATNCRTATCCMMSRKVISQKRSMDNQLAVVTGAGRGIGRAIAVRLATEHIPVVLVARSSEEITALRNDIVERGGNAFACPCDITSVEEVNALVKDIIDEIGIPTILVNNAGIAPSAKLEDTSDALWHDTFAVN